MSIVREGVAGTDAEFFDAIGSPDHLDSERAASSDHLDAGGHPDSVLAVAWKWQIAAADRFPAYLGDHEDDTRPDIVAVACRFEVVDAASAAGPALACSQSSVLVDTSPSGHSHTRYVRVGCMSHLRAANHSQDHWCTERCTVRRTGRHIAPVCTRCS